jgi:CubicO group peptidase (beta-lactamase class C family)
MVSMFWAEYIGLVCTRQLVEQGKIGLDEPIESVLPEVQEIRLLDGTVPRTKITLRMLVSI